MLQGAWSWRRDYASAPEDVNELPASHSTRDAKPDGRIGNGCEPLHAPGRTGHRRQPGGAWPGRAL